MPPFSSPPRDRASHFAGLKTKKPLKPAVNLLSGEPLNSFLPRGISPGIAEGSGLDAGTRQANGRLARQIARRTPNREAFTELLPILGSAYWDDPEQASREVGDLIFQLAELAPDHAQQLAQAVSRLRPVQGQNGTFGLPRQDDPAWGGRTQGHAVLRNDEAAGLPIPDYRKQVKGVYRHWGHWSETLDSDPRITPAIRRAFLETFAAEGGLEPDDQAMGGITPDTLNEVRDKLKFDSSVLPKDLTNEQRARVYWEFMDQDYYLKRDGLPGVQVLEDLDDHEAAAALFDTMFRHGSKKAPLILQQAINSVSPSRIAVDGRFGPASFAAYRDLLKDPASRRALLEAIAVERIKDKSKEKARANHFRFLPPSM